MADKKTLAEIKAELTERGIAFDPAAKYAELEKLLGEAGKTGAKPKRKIRVLAAGSKQIDLPAVEPVPFGNRTLQDHERRICALEVAAGIRKIDVTEAD